MLSKSRVTPAPGGLGIAPAVTLGACVVGVRIAGAVVPKVYWLSTSATDADGARQIAAASAAIDTRRKAGRVEAAEMRRDMMGSEMDVLIGKGGRVRAGEAGEG